MSNVVTLTRLDPQQQKPLEHWKFSHQTCIRVGRAPDNHVVIVDPLVSRYHLELYQQSHPTMGQSWRLVSKGTNGTFLNKVLTQQAWLTTGVTLELAQDGPLLRFELGTAVSTAPKSSPKSSNCDHAGNPPGSLFCIHCGNPVKIERQIRHYQVLRTLGQGGMGTTLLAWDGQQRSNQANGSAAPNLVVIKEMNADMAQIAKAQELFEREARTLKTLSHRGIPQFYDFFVEVGKKYLVMEMIHGQDLEKLVHHQGPVLPHQAIQWMLQTCKILEYLHSQTPPIVHRDIKPANLLLQRAEQRIVVIDFGAVKEIGTPLGTRIGAEGYSAPELDRGQPVTQSDVYAIGSTLIFLLTGKHPLNFYQKLSKGYGFDLESIPTIPTELQTVIHRATEYRVRDRYQTAEALAGDLGRLQM
ncbi:MAG: protein kinase [Microcoleaceae cyanobacterium]